MTREDRIRTALAGGEVDRLPCSVWIHLSEVDQDPRSLVEEMVSQSEKYDFDSIKMILFDTYSTQDWGAKIKIYCGHYKEPVIIEPDIRELGDYGTIRPLAATHGIWGRTLQITQHLSKIIPRHTPCLQTIFSPATTLKKLTSNRLIQDMVGHPEEVHRALRTITDTTTSFVQANIKAGVSGFFFTIQTTTYGFIADVLYVEFYKPYDLEMINSYRDKTRFDVIHIHRSNIIYDAVSKYPCNCINWHDRDTRPDMRTARETVKKTFLGGIQEVPNIINGVLDYDSLLGRSTPQQAVDRVKRAIVTVDGKGLIIGPGCVCDPKTSEENLHAARKAVEF